MRRIIQLPSLVANQIAAGEVIERPASVVKELVENSIDAQSSKIDIDIEGGGLHLIRVRDNGHGIAQDDLALAFARHATSKIQTSADLGAIKTLGFRGEALASIASIARCRLISRSLGQESASQIQLSPESEPSMTPFAHPQGTTIEVADIFYNTPVRRKFIRSVKTEFQAIEEVIKRLALSKPSISFRLRHNQKVIRDYPGARDQNDKSRLGKICGPQFSEQSLLIDMEAVGLSLRGWLGHPQISHRQSDCQYFFVNGRFIKDKLITHGIKSFYQGRPGMLEGAYPCYVLYFDLDPAEMDVNVHPTKQEVRFGQPRLIHDFLNKCLQAAFENVTNLNINLPHKKSDPAVIDYASASPLPYKEDIKNFTVGANFALIEEADSIALIDLSRAKTSMISHYFEKYFGNIQMKPLLFPLTIDGQLCPENSIAILHAIGFQIRADDAKVTVLKVPAVLKDDVLMLMQKLLPALSDKINIPYLCSCLGEWLGEDSHRGILRSGSQELWDEWAIKNKHFLLRFSHQQLQAFQSG